MSQSFCGQCGTEVSGATKFCPSCGTRVPGTSQTQFARLRELYDQALSIDVTRRDAWLDEACAGDPMLRSQLRDMLATGPEPPPSAAPSSPPSNAAPMVGPYRLLRELGRGGMGVVYLAVRDDGTFRKNVALKVLLRNQVSDEFVQRFKQERQVLAALDHPHIARILDGGDTPDGTPYYVMEYIEGLPIDKYCDQQRLSLASRVKLFQQVCQAVHYLHQNSIVHRDLKPSNIQISADGVAKLLDFGIAKLIGAAAASSPELTVAGGSPMTPTYASPEQLLGATLQKPSDIYSLGVVLYELLTGRSPYQGLDEKIASIASRRTPTPPSRNIREDLQTTESTAQLRRALMGELDSIILMSLNVDPKMRYQSAGDFAHDLQQFLDGQPVTAYHANVAQRSVKLIKRRRVMLASLAGFLLLGSFGVWQWRRADVADVTKTEIAERESKLRKLLEELESELTPEAATKPPEVHVKNVKRLQQALQTDFPPLAARTPGEAPERDRLLDRGVQYLDKLRKVNETDTRLGLEIANTYQQLGVLQESTLPKNTETNVVVINTYQKATVILISIAPESPEAAMARSRLESIKTRIEALGGTVTAAVTPAEADVREKTVKVKQPPAATEEPVVTETPATPAATDQTELQERLIAVASKVQIAQQAIDPIRQNLESSGQTLNADTTAAMRRMQSSLETAKKQFESGNFVAAKDSLAAADAFATRVLRTVGR